MLASLRSASASGAPAVVAASALGGPYSRGVPGTAYIVGYGMPYFLRAAPTCIIIQSWKVRG